VRLPCGAAGAAQSETLAGGTPLYFVTHSFWMLWIVIHSF